MENKALIELLNDLKITTICINECTLQMSKIPTMNNQYKKLYNERKLYLCDQILLTNKINAIINNY